MGAICWLSAPGVYNFRYGEEGFMPRPGLCPISRLESLSVESAVVEEADVESEIRALELSDLGDEAENMRQVLLKHQDVFKGLGLAKGEELKNSFD
jgi:hypothetical protein